MCEVSVSGKQAFLGDPGETRVAWKICFSFTIRNEQWTTESKIKEERLITLEKERSLLMKKMYYVRGKKGVMISLRKRQTKNGALSKDNREEGYSSKR